MLIEKKHSLTLDTDHIKEIKTKKCKTMKTLSHDNANIL